MKSGFLFLVIFFSCFVQSLAQVDRANVKGRLVTLETNVPIADAQLLISPLKQISSTDSGGVFSVQSLPFGTINVYVLFDNEAIDSFKVLLDKPLVELGDISIANYPQNSIISEEGPLAIPTVAIDADEQTQDEEEITSNQNVSILLNSAGSRDPFLNALSFVFGQYNFRPRAYNRSAQQVYVNGILMNDLTTGSAMWAQWSGLNEVLKNQNSVYGLAVNQQAISGLSGSISFDPGAIDQGAQRKLAYSISNRTYNNRVMYTHGSGLRKNGWAYTISGSRRWAQEAYISGTSLDAYSGFLSVGKVLNSRTQLLLNIIAATTNRARSGAATDEVYALTGNDYYNSNWGWQSGQKRNARMAKIAEPICLLQYQYKPSDHVQIATTISYQSGVNQVSSLDWYNAIDPRPDYYRNLPSYYNQSSPLAAQMIGTAIRNSPDQLQLDWARFYSVNKNNRETIYKLNGSPAETFSGNRSLYILAADVEQLKKMALASHFQYKPNDKFIWSGGLQVIVQNANYYRKVIDLLGGDYFVNYNAFAPQQYLANDSYRQYDLQTPNRAVKNNEKYKYNYIINSSKSWGWLQLEGNFRSWSMFASGSAGVTTYFRKGMYQNGLFASNSLGKSALVSFLNYSAKAGVHYKINGRNYLIANGYLSAEDPGINNIFITPRTRNQSIAQPDVQYTKSMEAGYLMRAPKLNVRAIVYATEINNSTSIQRFYNDEPEYQSFVNFVMRKTNTRYTGMELALEYAVNPMISLSAVAAVGQAFYTNRPQVEVYNDNDTITSPTSKEVFIKNYYLGAGPQSAYTAGIAYNSKRYWYVKVNANYLDRNYVAVNPSRRSVEAAELIEKGDPLFAKIFDQEKLAPVFTIDFSGGKSIRLSKISKKLGMGTTLYLNVGISNLLNQRYKSIGFEQLRYDYTNNNPDKFPTKYIYGFGRSFFANLSLKF